MVKNYKYLSMFGRGRGRGSGHSMPPHVEAARRQGADKERIASQYTLEHLREVARFNGLPNRSQYKTKQQLVDALWAAGMLQTMHEEDQEDRQNISAGVRGHIPGLSNRVRGHVPPKESERRYVDNIVKNTPSRPPPPAPKKPAAAKQAAYGKCPRCGGVTKAGEQCKRATCQAPNCYQHVDQLPGNNNNNNRARVYTPDEVYVDVEDEGKGKEKEKEKDERPPIEEFMTRMWENYEKARIRAGKEGHIIKKSPGKGLGVFAPANIPKGTVLGKYEGKQITEEEMKKSKSDKIMTLYTPRKIYVDGATGGNWTAYMNDANGPGKSGRRGNVRVNQRGTVIATENIKKGEELLHDYGDQYWDTNGGEGSSKSRGK